MAITKLGHMKEASRGNPGKHLKNAIHYILNPEKTEKMVLTGGNSGYTPDEIYQTFIRTNNCMKSRMEDRDTIISSVLNRERPMKSRFIN